MYCLGHKKFVHSLFRSTAAPSKNCNRFVSALHNPVFAPSELISGGGDPVLKIWDWMTGDLKHEVHVLDAIQPYMKVLCKKGNRRDDADDDAEAGKRKRKRGKGKEKATSEEAKAANGGTAESPLLDSSVRAEMALDDALQRGSEDKGESILVVHKISTVASETGKHIIFNAVGYVFIYWYRQLARIMSLNQSNGVVRRSVPGRLHGFRDSGLRSRTSRHRLRSVR